MLVLNFAHNDKFKARKMRNKHIDHDLVLTDNNSSKKTQPKIYKYRNANELPVLNTLE